MPTGIPLWPRPGQPKYRAPENDRIWLGSFADEVEAAQAYDRAAVQYFREFARLNLPEEWPQERRQKIYNKYPLPPAKGPPKKPLAKTPSRKDRKRTTPKTQCKTKKATTHAEARSRSEGKDKTKSKAQGPSHQS